MSRWVLKNLKKQNQMLDLLEDWLRSPKVTPGRRAATEQLLREHKRLK